ncbi:uncharacterized protein FIESC28_04097 [Fusarium coffeatum]|uniref:Uncharacterized protein n=1 Tax=Fusarium coffeatum TaxID=231269 RepID=A0A366S261_9HYPO|nr:uncharacterized protein FIESC28_04097 [Fusarium coffeatum]RBR23102.1 hypothetical protein FIESC28_04097 [Fusarium coffeatum]
MSTKSRVMDELPEDSESPMPSSIFDSDDDDTELISPLLLPLTVSIDEDEGQLSAPQTNTPAQLSIPRPIISSGTSPLLQAELLRPIFAGTYFNDPAYLVRLQLQMSLPGGDRSWLSRIQTAEIRVLIEDAPRDDEQGEDDEEDDESNEDESEKLLHPAIVKAFPGPSGWKGSPQSAEVTTENSLVMQIGYNSTSISYNLGESQAWTKTRAIKVKVAHRGPGRNILYVRVEENAVDKAGVPDYLVVPFIITHQSRRFRMRVAIHARFGLWRGKLADVVPILGRADEPLYFDPLVMRRVMEQGRRGVDGERVVEWRGALDEVMLQEYSSLGDENAA